MSLASGASDTPQRNRNNLPHLLRVILSHHYNTIDVNNLKNHEERLVTILLVAYKCVLIKILPTLTSTQAE